MHVALVGAHPLPGELSKGGVERVVEVMRRKLAERVTVSLVVPGARKDLRHTDRHGEITYVKRPPGPAFLTYWSWTSFATYKEIRRINPDIVHVEGAAGDALFWPGDAGTRKSPMVFTAHGVLDLDIVHAAGEDWLRKLTVRARAAVIRNVERTARRRYDGIIAINEYVLEAMPDIARERCHLIPNPVDDVFFNPSRAPRPNDGAFHLLQVGVVSPLKNILSSIRILEELRRRGPNAQLHIVGPVTDARYRQSCLDAVASRGMDRAVIFHGNATPVEVAAWMDRADLLLLTSKQEMAPMVVAEAHCRGLPVAVPRAFGLRWMVEEGKNGIFLDGPTEEGNATRIAQWLMKSVDRDEIRETAAVRYETSRTIDRTIAAYCDALRTSRNPIEQPVILERGAHAQIRKPCHVNPRHTHRPE